MPVPTLDLTRPQETRGRPLNKKLIVIGGLIVAGVVITVLWPAIVRAPRQRSSQPATVARSVKDSKALKSLPSTHQGQALAGEPPLPQVLQAGTPAATRHGGDERDAHRLRAENDQLRELLKRVPPTTVPAVQSKTPKPVDPEIKAREAERKRLEAADRKLVVWKAPQEKDTSRTIISLQHPLTPYTLSPLWKIPCQTEGPSSNEAPGIVTVRVKQMVWDSATGKHPLIPQETLIGLKPRGQIIAGDSRIPFEAATISFPNGTWAKPPASTVADQEGLAGLTGDINRHTLRIAGMVFFTSVLQGGTTVANTMSGDPTGQIAGRVTNNMSSEAQRLTRSFIRTDPTITIPAGTGCLIELEEPMTFAKPYPF